MKQFAHESDIALTHIPALTFRQTAEAYLSDVKGTIAATTYDRYLDVLERDIYPVYADILMTEIGDDGVEDFLRRAPGNARKQGRSLTKSSLQIAKSVLGNVISFSKKSDAGDKDPELKWERIPYEELTPGEIETILMRAKYDRSPEMLAALLSIYCGMRTGEIVALSSDDVDTEKQEIYIHKTAHRVRNPRRDEPGEKKTVIVVDEIPWSTQIRRVRYPEALSDHISEFRATGKPLIRNRHDSGMDPRTLEKRLIRTMNSFGIKGVNFERLRKTYVNGPKT